MSPGYLKKWGERALVLDEGDPLKPADGLGSGNPHEPEKDPISVIIERLNQIYGAGDWTDQDLVNHYRALTDKVMEKPNGAAIRQPALLF